MMSSDMSYLGPSHYIATLAGRVYGQAPWQVALAWVSQVGILGISLSTFFFKKYYESRVRFRHLFFDFFMSLSLVYITDLLLYPGFGWDPEILPNSYRLLSSAGGVLVYMQRMPVVIMFLCGVVFMFTIMRVASLLLRFLIWVLDTDAFSESLIRYYRKGSREEVISMVAFRRCIAYYLATTTIVFILCLICSGLTPMFRRIACLPRWFTSILYLLGAAGCILPQYFIYLHSDERVLYTFPDVW